MVFINKVFTVGVFTTIQMTAHLLCAARGNILDCPIVTGQHPGTKAINVIRSVAAEYIRQFDHDALKIGHQCIDGFCGHGLCCFSQMRVNTGGARGAMSQPDLD